MKILILEDDRERWKLFKRNFVGYDITITEFVDEAIELLKSNTYDAIFLDHDLGGKSYVDPAKEPTGYHVAKWLSENPDKCPKQVYIHSLNEYGAKRMQSLLPNSVRAPFLWAVDQKAV